jgi:hypothetical protein
MQHLRLGSGTDDDGASGPGRAVGVSQSPIEATNDDARDFRTSRAPCSGAANTTKPSPQRTACNRRLSPRNGSE